MGKFYERTLLNECTLNVYHSYSLFYSSMIGFEIKLRVKSEAAVHQRIIFPALADIFTALYGMRFTIIMKELKKSLFGRIDLFGLEMCLF